MITSSQLDPELAVTGCLLSGDCSRPTFDSAVERLSVDTFSRVDCRQAIAIIIDRHQDGQTTDMIQLVTEWKNRHQGIPPAEIIGCANAVESVLNLPSYIDLLLESAERRQRSEAWSKAARDAKDPSIKLDEIAAELERNLSTRKSNPVSVLDSKGALKSFLADAERRFQSKGRPSGVVTGFDQLDRLLDGLQFGEQTILAARPSHGKTALGLNVLNQAAIRDHVPTLFVSLEMSVSALMRRIFSSWASVPMCDLKRGDLGEHQFAQLQAFNSMILKCPVYFADGVSGMNVNTLASIVRRHCREHAVKLVVIDYLQKIRAAERHEKRTYEVGATSGTLKGLAVETGAAFLTLAQLNREPERGEKGKGRPPRLSDLADSGQIERDADSVLLLVRDFSSDRAQLVCAKNRDGELGIVDLHFKGRFTRFESAASNRIDPQDVPTRHPHAD